MLLGKTIGELCEKMTGREFAYWCAYLGTYPPEEDADFRAAIICDAIYKSAGSKTSKPSRFMPQRKRVKPQSMEDQVAILRGLTNGSNGGNRNDKTRRG